MHPMSMGAKHLGVWIQAPVQIKTTKVSRDCPYCSGRREPVQVSHGRGIGPFRKRSNNTPALGNIGAGVLFHLFPDSKKGWGSSSHPQSQGIQPSFKTAAFPYAQHINPFNLHQTRGLVHNSGPPGCLFSYPNSQEPQEVPKVLLSRQCIRVQCSPAPSQNVWMQRSSPFVVRAYV